MTPTQPGQPDLAELRRLAEAATPGPWWGDPPYGWGLFQDAPTHDERLWLFDRRAGTPADATYIVALVNAAPALLSRIEALETALRNMMVATHTAQLPGLRPCACAIHETARALLEPKP